MTIPERCVRARGVKGARSTELLTTPAEVLQRGGMMGQGKIGQYLAVFAVAATEAAELRRRCQSVSSHEWVHLTSPSLHHVDR